MPILVLIKYLLPSLSRLLCAWLGIAGCLLPLSLWTAYLWSAFHNTSEWNTTTDKVNYFLVATQFELPSQWVWILHCLQEIQMQHFAPWTTPESVLTYFVPPPWDKTWSAESCLKAVAQLCWRTFRCCPGRVIMMLWIWVSWRRHIHPCWTARFVSWKAFVRLLLMLWSRTRNKGPPNSARL